jgi:hypothetical protein
MIYALLWVIPRCLNYPEESIQHSKHGEILKSRTNIMSVMLQSQGGERLSKYFIQN